MATKKVVIVGSGFGGLNAAKKLAESKQDFDITVLDRHNYHLFQPLLYQVAMAGLSPGDIATPIRTVLANFPNVKVLMADVLSVDLAKRQIKTEYKIFDYDYLILACGAQHSYFGHEEWEPFAPGLKTVEQATEIRRRVLTAFELAERETDPEREKQLLTFAIVGGGPTGVELAGSLGEITRFTLSKDFRHIDPARTRIVLIEAGPRILASFPQDLSKRAVRDLEHLGVTVWTNTRVTGIDADGVTLGAEKLKTKTTLWAAGVKPSSLNAALGVPLDKAGRVIVSQDLSIADHREVFVIGDQACFIPQSAATKNGSDSAKPLPGLAPVAIQQGRACAQIIIDDSLGKPRKAFRYLDKGQMATIGRRRAIAQTGKLHMTGTLAWYAWLVVHIYYLVGFKNRILVILQWFWSYLTYKRGAQLITQKEWRSFSNSGAELPVEPKQNTPLSDQYLESTGKKP